MSWISYFCGPHYSIHPCATVCFAFIPEVLTLTLERVLPAPNERIFGQSEDPTVIVHAYDLHLGCID